MPARIDIEGGILSKKDVVCFEFKWGHLQETGPIVVDGLNVGRDVMFDINETEYKELEKMGLSFD